MAVRGGKREGAGRKRGSRNKATIARQAVAEILDINDDLTLEAVIHRRGHALLVEMERIVGDPTMPVGARIMAARTVLPFLLPRRTATPKDEDQFTENLVEVMRQRRNQLAEMRAAAIDKL